MVRLWWPPVAGIKMGGKKSLMGVCWWWGGVVIFVGVFVDVNRSQDVIAFGVGAGALVTGLAVFAFATKKDPSMKVSRKDFGSKKL